MVVMIRLVSMTADPTMPGSSRAHIVAWVASSILPHEAAVRAWLRARVRSDDEVDDLVQEAYAKLASLSAVDHIARPRNYFFQTVQNLLTDYIRRERIVRIEAVADIAEFGTHDDEPSPERIVGGRREYATVMALIDALPERCRQIFTLRKIEGLSQREIALRIGVSENVVENDTAKGLRLIMQALNNQERGRVRSRKNVK